MKPGIHRPRAVWIIILLLAALALLIWAVGMYCATALAAEQAADRYLEDNTDLADHILNLHVDSRAQRNLEERYTNYWSYSFWQSVNTAPFSGGIPVTEGHNGFLERTYGDELFWASAIYDAQGNLLECSWEDFLYFEYMTEEEWAAKGERSTKYAKAPFDRTLLTKPELFENQFSRNDAEAIRLTGTFDGVVFTPSKIEYVEDDVFRAILHEHILGSFTTAGVIQDYNLPWHILYENPDAVAAGAEVVTFYSDDFRSCYSTSSPSFTYNYEDYDDLVSLMQEVGPSLASGTKNLRRYEGTDLLIIDSSYCQTSHTGETYCTPYHYPSAHYQNPEEAPQLHFYLVTAVYCSPWKTAFGELREVYLSTFLFAGLLVVGLSYWLGKHLIQPVEAVNCSMEQDWCNLSLESLPRLTASRQLIHNYHRTQDKLRSKKNDISRLHKALDYAKEAEDNRRQLTSSIAHELKTPLAVIHSYAEGLQERINEDKREQYLSVILSECERMDSLVLEMLDLSRLEAGKVKLARDTFSLEALAKTTFDRLELAVQAKELEISYDVLCDASVTADEARIGQVITNFATNAVKYTKHGGKITIKIKKVGFDTGFFLENECEPLSQEALHKVWDTFYRTDSARSGEGTGLGLAISKSIIELHGGQVGVQNTLHGVEFRFVI